ncbi:MAG: hypothetical protein JO115_00775 [Pseudonocardiales bacterium]|nr:hypothetical protein [Pseudonocardiales bacterium]
MKDASPTGASFAYRHDTPKITLLLEIAERNLLSGTSPILRPPVITEIAHQLSAYPAR